MRYVLSVLMFAFVFASYAGSLYKWVDEDGNVIYQDTPPPSNVDFEEQEISEPESRLQEEILGEIYAASDENPISFYSLSDCDACDLVRLYLENNSIPFAEKDVKDNVTLQDELQGLTGALRVPTLAVGEAVIDGYSKSAIRQTLIDKGYPLEAIENNGIVLEESENEPQVPTQSEQDIQDIIEQFEASEQDSDPILEIESESG